MSFKVNRLVSAAYIAFGMAVIGATYTPSAFAQSNATGSIFGQAPAGSTSVVIESIGTGVKRTLKPDASGRFQATALPPGKYKAQLLKGETVASTVELEVLLGQGVEAVFPSSQLQAVQVTGRRAAIDVSSSNNGATFTSRQLESLPIQRDVGAIIQLAPNTTKADPRYAGGASIGGGAPSENSYYINGFPVTNALTQLGSIELPFGAISQAQVLTGGFGAEFGRSVGGVVNITGKSGTNDWVAGGFASYQPDALRSTPKSTYYPNTGSNPGTDGTIYRDRRNNKLDEYAYGGYFGGPLIKDKLFLFFAGDKKTTNEDFVSAAPQDSNISNGGWSESTDTNTRYYAKLDWYLTENNLLEATLLGDNYKNTTDFRAYSYANSSPTGGIVYSEFSKNLADVTPGVGGDAQIFKYTGNLTDDFTVTTLYGQSSSKHTQNYNFAPDAPTLAFNSGSASRNPNFTYVFPNPLPGGTTSIAPGAVDRTKAFRLDFEYRLGRHNLRAGLDEVRLSSKNAGDTTLGGSSWRFYNTTNGNFTGAGGTQTLIQAGAVPVNGVYYYARQQRFETVTDADSNQSAQYIEDRIKVTDNLQIIAGLRNESFKNKNGDGETFLESKNFLSPRLAATWDVNGDASMKLFGTAGRYSLQIPTHLAVRGASRSLFTRQFFTYTGIDPVTGAPIVGQATGPAFSSNNEYNQAKDPLTVSALDMKPTYQDELTLGIEKALSPELNGGARVTYRTLKATIDDLCDYRPFEKYAVDNNIDTSNWGGFGCATFNPGVSNSFLVDYSGTGQYTLVNLSAADLGFEKTRRTYFALDFFLEHPLKDGWYGRVAYTYSKSKGNTEGQTKSDNAQTDVAVTSTWDHPELMENINGLLPGDRTHQIKAIGFVQVAPEWMVGGNLLLASGRPKNCVGNYAGSSDLDGGTVVNGVYETGTGNLDYGNVYFYCDGQPSPRGSKGRLPWEFTFSGAVMYSPQAIKGLGFRVDVFNLFNRQSAQTIDETSEVSYDTAVLPTYGRVISYTAPRAVKFTATYDYKF